MILSRILMVLALAVLAYLVYITMTGSEQFQAKTAPKMNLPPKARAENMNNIVNQVPPQVIQPIPMQVNEKINYDVKENMTNETPAPVPAPAINYENFEAVDGVADGVHGAAPFGGKAEMDEGKFATVKYTGMVDGTPGDVIQIEGTDLLTAPLVDNMLYTNSIANTNRNASNDLRGDIPLQFNDTYTPFYSSVIYGAPLSQKQMTIGKI